MGASGFESVWLALLMNSFFLHRKTGILLALLTGLLPVGAAADRQTIQVESLGHPISSVRLLT